MLWSTALKANCVTVLFSFLYLLLYLSTEPPSFFVVSAFNISKVKASIITGLTTKSICNYDNCQPGGAVKKLTA